MTNPFKIIDHLRLATSSLLKRSSGIVHGAGPAHMAHEDPVEYEYIPEGWSYADNHPVIRGWDVEDIYTVYRRKWPQFVSMLEGTGPLGFSHESELTGRSDLFAHNLVMSFGYVLCRAARGKKKISILDWGGGLGHYYLLAKTLLPDVGIEYTCYDLPKMAALGSELLHGQRFTSDDRCFDRKYDLVVVSSSLHYSRNWSEVLTRLAKATKSYLYLARLPIVITEKSFVYVQRTYKYGYNSEMLSWCFNEGELQNCIRTLKFILLREFDYGEHVPIFRAPEKNISRGYLFTPPV
jgi:putative methyltransferase (TIGR04325 family)